MDTIHQENWSDMQHEFPYYIDGVDKQGRPVITAIVRDWDIRNAVMWVQKLTIIRLVTGKILICDHAYMIYV